MMRKFTLLIAILLSLACGDDNPVTTTENTNPEGTLYVLNQGDNTIYVYDTKTMIRIDSIDSRVNNPHYIEFSPDKLNFYITTLESTGHIAKYSAITNQFIDSVSTPAVVQPTAIVITNDNLFGYVCNFSLPDQRTKIHKYDLTTLTHIDSVQAGALTHDIKITSDGSTIVATNRFSDDITLVYTDADTVAFVSIDPDNDYPVGSHIYGPFGTIIDHNDSLAYIACMDARQVRVLDIKNKVIIDSVDIPIVVGGFISGPTLLAISPDDQYVYLTTRQGNSCVVLQTSPLEVVADIPFETPSSFGIDISDDGSRVYVACINTPSERGRIYVINGSTFTKVDSIDVGRESFGLRWQPKR